jgi:hypothetical protein
MTSKAFTNLTFTEYQPFIDQKSQFYCVFKNLSKSEMKLSVESEFENIVLTSIGGSIDVVQSISFSPMKGPLSGNFDIIVPFNHSNPSNYSAYEYSLEGTIFGEIKRISTCKLVIGKLVCPISSLKKYLSVTSKVRLDLHINTIKALSLYPYFIFYNDFEFKLIHPSSFIQKGRSGFIYLNSSLPLDFLGNNYRVQYFNNVTKIYGTCTFTQTNDIKCPFPSFNETGKFSIGISQSDVFEILGTQLTVYDSQWMSIDYVFSKSLSFTRETILYIIGSKFIDTSSIIVKCSDSFIENLSIAKYINETHIQTTIQPFYMLNIVFPRVLKVSVSFDGGLSFFTNNTNVYIDNLKNIELFPSSLSKGELTKGIVIKNYPEQGLFYNISKYTVDYYLNYNQTISLKLNCSKPQKSGLICDLTTPPFIVGNYQLKLWLINVENGQKEEIQITSVNWIYVYGKLK